ncbi:hypothetical protein MOV08_32755 [Streptomyces yunnanensis]|uniref:Integral membrane protein n=1 Tax=Streptomyces yunnanensis TaxID=156453 RepID=A0ABY8AFQ0_9ACTN|nr:hypothetical protein [Streptomyces yunnanensis]WEB43579.1 hypothetical protein MOV08_32755 [Streptomyces yunnanensis]
MPETAPRTTAAGAADENTGRDPVTKLGAGPGRLLVTLYGVFTVAAASRSLYQLIAQFDRAPLAYLLSAVSALVYGFITFSLVRGGEGARRAAVACCALELIGVVGIGTWTLVDPAAFADSTVWSYFGMDYLFIPVALPVTGLMWLRRARTATA